MPLEFEQQEQIRQIIREELGTLIKNDRFVFEKIIEILDDRNIHLGKSVGTKIGTETTQKLGFWNSTPIVQHSSTGESAGFTAGAGTTVTHLSTFTGNVGSTAYTIGDVIKALKNSGFIAQ